MLSYFGYIVHTRHFCSSESLLEYSKHLVAHELCVACDQKVHFYTAVEASHHPPCQVEHEVVVLILTTKHNNERMFGCMIVKISNIIMSEQNT